MYSMYELHVFITCNTYMYVLHVFITCMYCMYLLHVCIACMYCMYVLHVCITCMYYITILQLFLHAIICASGFQALSLDLYAELDLNTRDASNQAKCQKCQNIKI